MIITLLLLRTCIDTVDARGIVSFNVSGETDIPGALETSSVSESYADAARELRLWVNHYGYTAEEQIANDEAFFSLASIFPQIFVLCMGKMCVRHQSGNFWTAALQPRVVLFDGEVMHKRFYQLDVLRFTRITAGRPYHKLANVLFFGYMVGVASSKGLDRVLYLEDDAFPMEAPPFSTVELDAALRTQPWHILRLGATFSFSVTADTDGGPPRCAVGCSCSAWGGIAEGLCDTAWTPVNYSSAQPRWRFGVNQGLRDESLQATPSCDLRSSVGVGVHQSAFHDVAQMYDAALGLLNAEVKKACDAVAAGTNLTACRLQREQAAAPPPWEPFYGSLPWLDIWLPVGFHNVYVIPVSVSQKNTKDTGTEFWKACGRN